MRSLILILTVALVVGCSGNGPTEDNQIPSSQNIIAGWQYINWAWGYNHTAVYIDRDGNQLAVSYELADSLWLLSGQEELSIAEMNRLLSKAHPSPFTIPKDTVRVAAKLARHAVSGPYSDTTMTGADMGANEWFGFVFDQNSGMYHRVMLKVQGDWSWENEAISAKELVALIDRYRLVNPVLK